MWLVRRTHLGPLYEYLISGTTVSGAELLTRLGLLVGSRCVLPAQQSSEANLSLDVLLARHISRGEASGAKELIHLLESPTLGLRDAEVYVNRADGCHHSEENLARC